MSDPRIAALESQLAALSQEVVLLRDIQAIRTLHFTYGYCMDKWLFKEIVDLFAEDCELRFLNCIWRGKEGARRLYSWTEGMYGPRDGMLEYFLTERYCLFTLDNEFHALQLDIHHPPWPLPAAEAEITVNTMADACGIRLPAMKPLLHFARRQDMVAWMPQRVDAKRRT